MDRKLLKLPFAVNNPPDWVCPTCAKGVLRIKKGTFFKDEIRSSRGHGHDAWEPEWIEYVYSCMLVCTNDQCKETVATSGVGSVNMDVYHDENGEPTQEYDDFFHPKFFEPHLVLLNIPKKCPERGRCPRNC